MACHEVVLWALLSDEAAQQADSPELPTAQGKRQTRRVDVRNAKSSLLGIQWGFTNSCSKRDKFLCDVPSVLVSSRSTSLALGT